MIAHKFYKWLITAFIIYVFLINTVSFLTTFNPKSLINPFNIKNRSISTYLLVKNIVFVSGVAFRKTDVKEVNKIVDELSKKYEVDPKLVKAMIKVESDYRKFAISRAGAMGLMQIMPKTFAQIGTGDPFIIENNLEAGIKYISIQLKSFNNTEIALAAYNAGPHRVRQNDNKIPNIGETRIYVKKIMEIYKGAN